MFTHKPRISEDIPDFKGFLVYLKKQNAELHDRYMYQVKRAAICDITMTVFAILGGLMAVLSLVSLMTRNYITTEAIVELVVFVAGLAGMIVASIFGRKAHTEAIRIESEIVVEYHRSGFKGQ
jgi:predicted MFS family arabinose efflux permease